MTWSPATFIVCGVAVALVGWMLIFAMLLGLLPLSFALSALGYSLSIAGVAFGLWGLVNRSRRDEDS